MIWRPLSLLLSASATLFAATAWGQASDIDAVTRTQSAGFRRAEALLAESAGASFIQDADQRDAAQRQAIERTAAELETALAVQARIGTADYSSAVLLALIGSEDVPADQLQKTVIESHPAWIRLDLATRWPSPSQPRLSADQIEIYRLACEQRGKLFGNDHWWTQLGKLDYASALIRRGRLPDAEPILRSLVEAAAGQGAAPDQRLATAVDVRSWAGSLLAQWLFLQDKEDPALQILEDVGESESALASWLRARRGSGSPRELVTMAFGHNQIAGIGGPGSSLADQELAAEAVRRNRINLYLNALVELGPRSAEALDLGNEYEWGLASWKGAVFDEQRRIYAERRHPALRQLFDQLDGVISSLAALPAGSSKSQSDELSQQEQALRDISRGRDRLPKMLPRPPTQQLPEKAVLLDFYEYERIVPQPAGGPPILEPRLLCFIGRPPPHPSAPLSPLPPQHVKVVDLGNREPIRAALEAWRIALRGGEGGLPTNKQAHLDEAALAELPQNRLYDLLWRPLANHVGSAELVVIIPDGDLWFLPFAALSVPEERRYLLEKANIVIAAHPRMLEHYQSMTESQARYQKIAGLEARPTAPHMLLVGNIDYTPALPVPDALPGQNPATLNFQPLPGTKAEIDALAVLSRQHFPGTNIVVLQSGEPTESAVREKSASARYVHFATHGFLRDDRATGRRLSALALAGINTKASGLDDGVMTSLEGSTFDLNATELVVLSACETGLGTPVQGEGLAGLQSMLHLGGARSVVSSLWQVDDRATQVLMVEFYRNLWQRKQNKAEALRNAQLAMLRGELNAELRRRGENAADPRAALGRGLEPVLADKAKESVSLPPFYWAAFLLSGDWR